ncbi:CLUMA_CG005720, isoform A [Clunio marinus]|uniref:CLUMA_CG005720, isoform A n=1 Tax=Clunio marinus TaxID=568069 RepID=A0A1J1HVM6_9DIPT|nr:CLUMA_CG005720, isoform A [Clunio marinus]
MSTLEDKIMGEKLQYYCSSSEDEKEGSGDEGDDDCEGAKGKASVSQPAPDLTQDMTHWQGNSANTGPKGVIKDWQRFKQLENEKRQDQERERLELMKKLSITAKTTLEDQKAKERDELDAELEELLNDDFLQEFQKRRMQEMLAMPGMLPKFGTVISLKNGEEFLQSIDGENKNVTVIIHIYEERFKACKTMNKCIAKLAQEYTTVKFCKILSVVAGLSKKFKTVALPTILVYKNGQVIGNFIRMSEEFGDEFYASDVESYLIEHALLPDKSLMPAITSSSTAQDDNDE